MPTLEYLAEISLLREKNIEQATRIEELEEQKEDWMKSSRRWAVSTTDAIKKLAASEERAREMLDLLILFDDKVPKVRDYEEPSEKNMYLRQVQSLASQIVEQYTSPTTGEPIHDFREDGVIMDLERSEHFVEKMKPTTGEPGEEEPEVEGE